MRMSGTTASVRLLTPQIVAGPSECGESLLLWLRDKARPHVDLSQPQPEDWRWYSFVTWKGRQYLLGSSASEEGGDREWILQIDKQRSVREKLFGREKMTSDDECARFFQRLLEQEPSFRSVSADPDTD